MSLVKISPQRIESFSLTLHPIISYLSSSTGTSGSAPLRGRPSKCIKEIATPAVTLSGSISPFDAASFEAVIALKKASSAAAAAAASGTSANVRGVMESYLTAVGNLPNPLANSKRLYITRFDPPFTLNDVAIEKSIIRDNLMTFYQARYDLCEMAYTNYHTLNFLSAPNTQGSPDVGKVERLPDDSAIIYQNFRTGGRTPRPYSPSGSFSLDFYINPRYANDPGREFNAGTIMHLSSTLALSLVSGSSRDQNDLVDGFRLVLQLSHSADVSPSTINNTVASRTYPQDLIFLTPDNSLSRNKWHHVTIRWGTESYNKGTGSINIDSDISSSFVVPSGSILPPPHISTSALFIGNYYEGSGSDTEAKFFNKTTEDEGVVPVLDFGPGANHDPSDYFLRHPLNAEIHELKLYKKYLTGKEVHQLGTSSPTSLSESLAFYVPPMFSPDAPPRNMIVTPFQVDKKRSSNPFNEDFSFGVGGFIMNLENHVKDFATYNFPRLLNLTASTIDTTIVDISAEDYVYSTGSIKKRNLTILPCDNGMFRPDYGTFITGSIVNKRRMRNAGALDISVVSIEDMIPSSAIYPGLSTVSAEDLASAFDGDASSLPDDISERTLAALIEGVTPTSTSGTPGPILTIAQRTRDLSSNEICFFDISNLYYGNQIQTDSLYVTDLSITGSDGKMKMTLKDNGRGGMCRADADGPHSLVSNIGNCLYPEGIVIIKSPCLSYFGKDQFEIKFKGEQNIHISTLSIPLVAGNFNSSSNPSYKLLSASESPSDEGEKFVYIDSLNIHDENLNVIMRSNLAQPIKKRVDDSMVIRFKMDF